jgi:predicted lipid-binding transport protein (Tim44 family)
MDTTLVSIDNATFDGAGLRDHFAQITVRFAAKLITATHDRAGELIEGNPDKVVDIIDIWTFARDVDSRNPNWKLVATQTGH